MKISSFLIALLLLCSGTRSLAQAKKLFIDVHQFTPGSVSFTDVAAAHSKDIAVQSKYGVQFLKYWVDENKGLVYCLSWATDSSMITAAHKEAHGLLPREIHSVTDGIAGLPVDGKPYFLDIHYFGAGKVTASDVAKAHQKDLAMQSKYGVNFINYWVDEENGIVYCLSQASDASKVIQTHKEAHGLSPDSVTPIKQGQ